MNPFDKMILEFFNRFSQRSWTFDQSIFMLSDTSLLKVGILVVILWALWFSYDKEEIIAKARKTILGTYVGTFGGLFLAKILEIVLPFRERPLRNPALNFRLPYGVTERCLEGWGSFPSDTATLAIGLATGVFLISRRFGLLSFGYALLFVLFPRIYLGLHHPTDIIGGALLGSACVMFASVSMMKNRVMDPLYEWSEKNPRWFYGLFFLVTYQTAVFFRDIRYIGNFVLRMSYAVVHRVF